MSIALIVAYVSGLILMVLMGLLGYWIKSTISFFLAFQFIGFLIAIYIFPGVFNLV